jgi:hypothetical protein
MKSVILISDRPFDLEAFVKLFDLMAGFTVTENPRMGLSSNLMRDGLT